MFQWQIQQIFKYNARVQVKTQTEECVSLKKGIAYWCLTFDSKYIEKYLDIRRKMQNKKSDLTLATNWKDVASQLADIWINLAKQMKDFHLFWLHSMRYKSSTSPWNVTVAWIQPRAWGPSYIITWLPMSHSEPSSVLCCHLILLPVHFLGIEDNQTDPNTEQILTHSGGFLLTVVAQWLAWGESSGTVHSSGTAVRCGPFPLSQIYKATWKNPESCGQAYELRTECNP